MKRGGRRSNHEPGGAWLLRCRGPLLGLGGKLTFDVEGDGRLSFDPGMSRRQRRTDNFSPLFPAQRVVRGGAHEDTGYEHPAGPAFVPDLAAAGPGDIHGQPRPEDSGQDVDH